MADPARICLQTLGCKLNQAETDHLKRRFRKAGCQVLDDPDNADVYILNTCTVTHVADRKSRHLLRLARRRNPDAFIIATGCYAERAPGELAKLDGVDLVIGNRDKAHLPEILEGMGKLEEMRGGGDNLEFRTRALVKIQDGCSDFCSYCIVPRVRGRERSVPIHQVVEEVKERVREGYREVILTGTQIGAYGRDIGKTLVDLLECVLAETEIERLRLTSLQPQDITPSLLRLWSDERLCRHLHIPLQSGCDSVLLRMRRRYSTTDFERAVTVARDRVPDISITTDIIVGFPGESEDEFEESYRFCERMGFAAIHVFPFSPRAGTSAALMLRKVDERVKCQRGERMLKLGREGSQSFRKRFLGRTMKVLWESRVGGGVWSGFTDNYIRVFASSTEVLSNRLVAVRLVGEHSQGLWGRLEEH